MKFDDVFIHSNVSSIIWIFPKLGLLTCKACIGLLYRLLLKMCNCSCAKSRDIV